MKRTFSVAPVLFMVVIGLCGVVCPAPVRAINVEHKIHCLKNGEGQAVGTADIVWSMGHPNDRAEPARACNKKYTNGCEGLCQGCYYEYSSEKGRLARCYDDQGKCRGDCDGYMGQEDPGFSNPR